MKKFLSSILLILGSLVVTSYISIKGSKQVTHIPAIFTIGNRFDSKEWKSKEDLGSSFSRKKVPSITLHKRDTIECAILVHSTDLSKSRFAIAQNDILPQPVTFTVQQNDEEKVGKNQGREPIRIRLDKKDLTFDATHTAWITKSAIHVSRSPKDYAELTVTIYTVDKTPCIAISFAKDGLVSRCSKKELVDVVAHEINSIEFEVFIHPTDLSKSHAINISATTIENIPYWENKIQEVATELELGQLITSSICYGGYIGIMGSEKIPHLMNGKRIRKGDMSTLRVLDIAKAAHAFNLSEETQKYRAWDVLRKLALNYKVHIMPKNEAQMIQFLHEFLKELKENETLRSNLSEFKIHPCLREGLTETEIKNRITHRGTPLPLVVLYTASSKEATQYVVDTLYRLFKEVDGLDITPRFNEKITSFIYVAQGNGDDKTDLNDSYFEQPDKIYYRKDIETLRWPLPQTTLRFERNVIPEVRNDEGILVQEAKKLVEKDYHITHPGGK